VQSLHANDVAQLEPASKNPAINYCIQLSYIASKIGAAHPPEHLFDATLNGGPSS
jgi:hypothetical protein